MRSGRLLAVQLGQRLDQLRRQLAGEHGLRPAVETHSQVLADLDLQLSPFQLDDELVRGAAEEGGDGGAAGAGAGAAAGAAAAVEAAAVAGTEAAAY